MPLDPKVRAYLDQMASASSSASRPPAQTRQARRELYGKVEDRLIPGPAGSVPIRVYVPNGAGPFPILVYFHGGGFSLGDIDATDPYCRTLSYFVGCVTVSVDYRLGPENKFPAASDDCYAATLWVAENARTFKGDPTRVAVGGASAGGDLAAVVALMARDHGAPHLVYQLLECPMLDLSNYDTTSWRELGDGYSWTKEVSQFLANQCYLRDEADAKNPLASPLLAPDLSDLPPALIVIAEYDPLKDEDEAYAARLQEAGVSVEVKRYAGVIHGFHSNPAAFDQSAGAIADIAKALKVAFAKG